MIKSKRLLSVKPSPTKAITQKARQMKQNGRDVITLSQGEPDFDTPPHIIEAAKIALDSGETRYTEVAGKLSLREAISEHIATTDGISIPAEQITVGCGAKQTVFNALMSLISAGDEVIVPAPYWVSYPDMVYLADGTPVIVECPSETGFKLTADALRNAITPNTRCLLLNSPNNPTGAVYTEEELAALAQVLAKYPDITVISDEIYRDICYTAVRAPSMWSQFDRLSGQLLVISGVSKAFAMTGWRVGYAAGPAELVKSMNIIQSQSSSHTCSVAQAAAEAAYRGSMEPVRAFTNTFNTRRNLLQQHLDSDLIIPAPDGAFYLFPSCKKFIGLMAPTGKLIESDMDFAEFLLTIHGVAVVPGSAFGAPGYIRLSYATDNASLIEACKRISVACNALREPCEPGQFELNNQAVEI